MAEEAKDEAKTIPRGDQPRRHRRLRDLRRCCRPSRSRALPVTSRPTASTTRCSACPRTRAASPATRCSASSSRSTSASSQRAGELYVGLLAATILFIATNAGHHRRLAARLLDGHAPPGARPPAPAAPEVRHAVDRDPRLRRDRLRDDDPGQGRRSSGNMYAFGAMLSFTIAHVAVIRLRITQPGRRAALPRAGQRRASRGRDAAAVRGLRRHRHGAGVRRRHVRCTSTSRWPASAGWRSACVVYVVYRRRQGLDLTTTTQGRDPAAGRRARGRVRVGARRVRRATTSTPRRGRDRRQARRAPPPRHPRARDDHRARVARRSTPTMPEQELAAQALIEQAKLQGGRRVTGHWREGARRAGRAA